jgi:hypothetical protein
MTNVFAQDDKSIVGYYRASGPANLLLENDHSFYIIAYATFIQGHWSRENDQIKLVPHNPEHAFDVYARYNPNIKEGYKIKFNDFYKKQTFIGTGSTDTMQRVFNPAPNCFNNPYTNHFPGKADSISFVDDVAPEFSKRNTYTFKVGKYNDFVAVYHDPSKYHREIILRLEQKAGRLTLKSESGQFENGKMDKKLQREIQEIRELAKEELQVNDLYCNPSYRPFDITSVNFDANYTFDTAKNAWISKYNYEKDEEINPEKKEDAYHSIGILYKYEKMPPANISSKQFKINEKSLFTAKCNDQD